MRWEGEDPPDATDLDVIAGLCHRMLADANGGICWPSLPLAMQLYGGEDRVEALVESLITYKHHRPPSADRPGGPAGPGDEPAADPAGLANL